MFRPFSRCISCFLSLVLLFACPFAARAQQETATITGEVKDVSGAVVPQAIVIITNVGTNISVKTETNDQGSYTVPSLRPGDYTVTVEKAGFNKTLRSGVTLQVNQFTRIDITLQTGQVSEVVEVTGGAPLLETETSSRGSVIDQKKDRRFALERPRLQPTRTAVARRFTRHAASSEREFQRRAQRQRQSDLQ